MSNLLRTLLARRSHLSDRTILDCLDLAEWLRPRILEGLPVRITTAELMTLWGCDQPTVSRRISVLRENWLLDAKVPRGRGASMTIYRVGPAA